MKKIFLAAILITSVSITNAQTRFDALTFSPQFPKAGQTVNFTFDGKMSPLIDEKKVDIVVYLFGKKGMKVMEPQMLQKGKQYSGSFKTDDNTACIAFGFSSNEGKLKDNNAGNGYVVPVYGNNNQPVMNYYYWAGVIQNGYAYLFDMEGNADKALALMEEGLKANPDAKNDASYFSSYLNAINAAKKKEGQPVIIQHLKDIESKPNITDAEYGNLVQWYSRLKMKSISDSFATIRKEKFPDGTWKKAEMANAIRSGKDAEAKKTAFEAYIKEYPPKEEDQQIINNYKALIASAYNKEKNSEAFKTWSKDLPMSNKAGLYNDISWYMAIDKVNLPEAKLISYEATNWAKKQMTTPTEKKPDSYTKKDWGKELRYQYGMYADTYAFILYNMGEYKEGYAYAKEAAAATKFKNAEYNERYTQLLVKAQPTAVAKKEIENLVKDGAASSKTKGILKELYIKEKGSDKGYDEYLTKLEMAAKEKQKEELAKKMINVTAPKFNLKDLDGKDISLEAMRGKVVVVDFWATWCGPCIASMPAMKIAQEKLKARNDVAFVFVDTWESVDNKKQNAADFMTKNNYPFHVLLDDDSKVVADFKVNGIPTKFVIDKSGYIRFKSVGFGGNDDALIDEVSMMVEMASNDMPKDRHVK
jgi:thiol-disulfide isomerase/thioredoxin